MGQMMHDFKKIRDEIEAETNRSCGPRGITSSPIRLRIYSPHVLDLTLVDLPGLTKVPIPGQPANIVTEIRNMALQFINKPNAIILAVHAANTDMANSDGIQLALEVDPAGERTVGVITKIDIMDKGTDALDMLKGRVIPLKLGYVGVVNRCQADINAGKSIREAIKSETEYFSSHPLYRSLSSTLGTSFLTKQLNKVLMDHIRDNLPELKHKINKMMMDAQREMDSYGGDGDMQITPGGELLNIITSFSSAFCDAIDGKIRELSINQLYGGARINYVFQEIYAKCIDAIDPSQLSPDEIRNAIKNVTGTKSSLFVPEESFEQLVIAQVTRLEDPSLDCVDHVHKELMKIVEQLESKDLQRYQVLRARVIGVVHNLLRDRVQPTKEMIVNLINIEKGYINTTHEDFIGGGQAIGKLFEKMAMQKQEEARQGQQGGFGAPQQSGFGAPQQSGFGAPQQSGFGAPQQSGFGAQQQSGFGAPQQSGFGQSGFGGQAQQSGFGQSKQGGFGAPPQVDRLQRPPMSLKAQMSQMTDKEKFEVELIQNLIGSYFDIVRKNVGDSVPKTIMHFLVNGSKTMIQNELVKELYREDQFSELLSESPMVAERRRNCKELLGALKKANDVLTDVRDYNVSRV